MSVTAYLEKNADVWDQVVAKYDLRSQNLRELVGQGDQHADFAFAYGAPEGPRAFVSTIKLRRLGSPTRNDPPRLGNPPAFDLLSGPRLSCDTLDEFIMWAATVPISHVDVIRQRISKCRGDDRILDTLLDALWKLPIKDVGRHRVILSILGELRNERAMSRLEEFVWYEGELTLSVPHPEERRPCMFESSGTELLQSRAAEMLSYLATEAAAKATMRIARDHPKLAVRVAAIDAHLFNHGDSREAAEELRKIVRGSDRPLVGLPRKVRGADVEDFERAVFEWYERNPEHRPPKPKQNHDYPPQPRSWFKKQNGQAKDEV